MERLCIIFSLVLCGEACLDIMLDELPYCTGIFRDGACVLAETLT